VSTACAIASRLRTRNAGEPGIRRLYHQIHPVKLATDIGVTPISLYFLWQHRIAPAIIFGFVPPLLVTVAMMIWPPDLQRLRDSALGKYISKYMTPTVEVIRLLTLVPMAWGAWTHNFWVIVLGLVILLMAWCNGLIVRRHV
jgi:hypothetical protein